MHLTIFLLFLFLITTSTALQGEDNEKESIHSNNYYPNGNVKIEIDGDTSHLFSEDDFKKVEAKPLYNDKNKVIDNSQHEHKSTFENEIDLDHIMFDEDESKKIDTEPFYKLDNVNIKNETISLDGDLFKNETLKNTSKNLVECSIRNDTIEGENKVKIVNGSILSLMLAESMAKDCFIVLFYVPWCPFSIRIAPYYNALPRAFNQPLTILAFDVSQSTGYNTKFGTSAVPMILIFQQKNVVAKYNHTAKNLTDLIEFVSKNTGFNGNRSINHILSDFDGPVPTTIVKRFDYALLLAWIFLILITIKIVFKRFNIHLRVKRYFMKIFNHQHQE